LDTRDKIKPLKDLNSMLADSKWIAMVGLFDPLTAAQTRRLADAAADGRKVLAIVLTGSDTMLPADARAALIAAVRDVDAVVIAGEQEWRSAIHRNAGVVIVDDPEGEKRRSAEFVKFILERQGLH
jgi:hypothetical protein